MLAGSRPTPHVFPCLRSRSVVHGDAPTESARAKARPIGPLRRLSRAPSVHSRPMQLEQLRQLMEEFIPFNRHLGIKIAAVEPGRAHLTLPFQDHFVGDPLRPALHGGVLSTMADVAGGMAVWSHLLDPRARVSTIDLRVDYLRPARLHTLDATAVVVRQGNRVGVVDVKLFHPDRDGEVVATGKGVYNITFVKEAKAP